MFGSSCRLSLLLVPALAVAFPPSMDIGAFAIDNYSATGGGMSSFVYMIASGQNLFTGANANLPVYSATYGAEPMGPNSPWTSATTR